MPTKEKNIVVPAIIIAVIGALIAYVLGSLFVTPLLRVLVSNDIMITSGLLIVLSAIRVFLGMFLAAIIYYLAIAKSKLSIGIALALSLVAGIITGVLATVIVTPVSIVYLLIYAVVIFCFALLLLTISKLQPTQANQYDSASYSTSSSNANATGYTSAAVHPENLDDLCTSLLNAIKPSLKAPLSAILCSKEELRITQSGEEYHIEGYVNSQNSFGAMIATDFSASARYANGTWVITDMKVGVKAAKNTAKNFAINYIAITIFVLAMGLLSYFLISSLI